MSQQHNQNSTQETPEPYTPASPVKRTLAWIGLVYMAIIVALTTYFYFTATMLGNLGPLLTVPAMIGAGVLMIVRHRTEGMYSKKTAYLTAICFWVAALITLPIGITGLLSNFGG